MRWESKLLLLESEADLPLTGLAVSCFLLRMTTVACGEKAQPTDSARLALPGRKPLALPYAFRHSTISILHDAKYQPHSKRQFLQEILLLFIYWSIILTSQSKKLSQLQLHHFWHL
jgi:hypothetical protein